MIHVVFDRHSVVDSVGGDQHLAVDALLAMSDPDHVSVPQHAASTEQPSQVRHIIHAPFSILLCLFYKTNLPTNLPARTPHSTHTPSPPQRLNKPSWTRSLRASYCLRMSSSMPATRSRCDSNSNRSRCASSLMRSGAVPTRRSLAVMPYSNNRSRSGIRCRTCRNSLVKSPKVRIVSLRSPP